MSDFSLHPAIDNGLPPGDPDFKGGELTCHCASNPVRVEISGNVLHNHACGCSKCWKPEGATFSIVGVVPKDNLKVIAGEHKLTVVDPTAVIQRNACKDCGVHLFGEIQKLHPFQSLVFVHVHDLSKDSGWQPPQFAAFVSSIVEAGFDASKTPQVRQRFQDLGLEPYDCLSPALQDAIADWQYKQKSKL